jgi:hypothetical protein
MPADQFQATDIHYLREIRQVHKDVCLGNGVQQTPFYHRQPEGTLEPVPGYPNNTRYTGPGPRAGDNPMDAPVLVWLVSVPPTVSYMVRSGMNDDTEAFRSWIFRMIGQCPSIDDNDNVIAMADEDFFIDSQQRRMRIEIPVLSPDGAFWTFGLVRQQ